MAQAKECPCCGTVTEGELPAPCQAQLDLASVYRMLADQFEAERRQGDRADGAAQVSS
jgi:hypothetical protein